MVNSFSKTQLALINIHAGNLIRSSRLILFSERYFLTLDTAVVVQAGNLMFAARSLSWGLHPPELSHEQHLNQRLFKEIEKNFSDGSEATSFPTSTALNCCVTTKRLPAFHVLFTIRAFFV